jgi:hypothetical protein
VIQGSFGLQVQELGRVVDRVLVLGKVAGDRSEGGWFAPIRWQPGIARLLDRYPFDGNVFCMTRYPRIETEDATPDPIRGLIQALREVLRGHGLTLHLASDRQVDDELFGNVGAHMWACRHGVGLLEDRAKRGLNYNAAIEVGSMLITGRRCAILKDRTSGPASR